ncbi:conjugation system SOS inhibitor PsiB [Salmonella enterica]|uniref:Conjugation system SOS inhibitor PsiB n=1 Tax=Salmonella enterica subsp. enterica serovar Java TaxID=224729 RepID=A0A3Z6QQW9_SALEB|nr:conjugation system SOS inhibitor PsiB [Salmonella enterica subsp. enterica serovar Java]EAO8766901.1 conjugation system SOS inhibitor PsiB [Salmonella enterica]ECD9518004.1 conjugation system SOS inhibitor PsiB [Salmonella enterica subsp. diarizonae]EDQ0182524.1 conjugation system SOS inhibitor PsiB [Salmonella enterica subsp. enterica serovar 4,[5],12:b:-]EEE5612837.1 conjugation system SOS inhibitor PsiB [Salmonella enterica subsp. enterica serovar Typhimurium]EGL0768308.1 conjugation sys
MKNQITVDVLKKMTAAEYEEYRAGGDELRRELTHAVMRDLTCPAGWDMNGEYRSEFGGFFPVQVRFTPSHGNFHLAVCSPGDVSPEWLVIFMTGRGRPFSVICTLASFCPVQINHTLRLVARLDDDGYSFADIISILAEEGSA